MKKNVSNNGPIGIEEHLGKEISVFMPISFPDSFTEEAQSMSRYAKEREGAFHWTKHHYNDNPQGFVAMGKLMKNKKNYFLRRGCPGGKQFSIPVVPRFVIGVAPIGEMFDEEIRKI